MALGTSYTDLGATASDLSYATDRQLDGVGKVDHNEKRNYTIVYTDEDAAGNTATIIRNIIVEGAPSINITLFNIGSSNSDSSYAKAGDTLTIQSSINYTIASYTATILGIPQSVQNQNSKGFLISEIVPSNLTVEEYATFSITIIDENGLPNTLTHDDLKSDNVFVDTRSPTVELDPLQISISVNQTLPPIIPEYNIMFTYGSFVLSRRYTVGDELTRSNVIAIASLVRLYLTFSSPSCTASSLRPSF